MKTSEALSTLGGGITGSLIGGYVGTRAASRALDTSMERVASKISTGNAIRRGFIDYFFGVRSSRPGVAMAAPFLFEGVKNVPQILLKTAGGAIAGAALIGAVGFTIAHVADS